ncbi:hypothetical protein [Bradyrhizobium sp. ORS 375]|uniref:hypothetical protein n=1 Tax=Bradyrhizobium sp. (strain ORS 375) TaxID=566679 RepID=UPI001111A0A8|nr:hypothetical protein [Bradyrhizobium sp. ORS 375]
MTKKAPYARGRMLCIFCGSPGVTKEHFWGRRFARYFPDHLLRTQHHTMNLDPATWLYSVESGRLNRRQGGLVASQLKVVCRACNEGWMRESVHEPAAQTLKSLFLGRWPTLGLAEMLAISRWTTLFTMIHDFTNPASLSINPSDRAYFRENRLPPIGWTIMIGRYSELRLDRQSAANQFGYRIVAKDGPEPIDGPNNAHTNAIAAGKIVLRSSQLPSEAEDPAEFAARYGLTIIWPAPEAFKIPPTEHDYRSFDVMATDIARRLRLPFISYEANALSSSKNLARPGLDLISRRS